MRIIETYHEDLLNGVGLREVLFFSGCEWKCEGCFQPWTRDPMCDQSREWTENDYEILKDNLSKNHISGVTLSGGDPLSHWNESGVLDLVKRIRKDFGDTKTIWLYTGYKYEDIAYLVRHVDVVVDGPFDYQLADKKYHWAGSTNQRVIDVKRTIQEGKVVLYEDH